ncbi:hypothetical protein FRACA_2310002 [Frankia canadensis]|uniref:Novel STAND NTPase 1 domain-containing protein n=1 Tax=Frankia canadensis TaxID=1836972 RepID=A0A2I2KRI9_9ACTN|nr:hypothetical protein [Frankia canadensis]SNQ48256.1 hypothetical protein FRACA_2310002 [Frankia canadensis]SOU55546.1 hypothetical protein FRACA_2310002 [Frankia canadensis]
MLVESRLVSVDQDSIEIIHEALLREWPRLQTWIADNQARLRARDQLLADAGAWEAANRDDSRLYRGKFLDEALESLGMMADLGGSADEFLRGSIASWSEGGSVAAGAHAPGVDPEARVFFRAEAVVDSHSP